MESMRNRFTATTSELMERCDDLALVLADIGVDRFRATGAIERHRRRIVNVGIREQLMIGVTAGFALAGYRPIAHTYAPFLVERAFEQIKLDLVHQLLQNNADPESGQDRNEHVPVDNPVNDDLIDSPADEIECRGRDRHHQQGMNARHMSQRQGDVAAQDDEFPLGEVDDLHIQRLRTW